MTNELEKQFFETFEIEPKCVKRTLKLAMQGYDESDLPEDLKQFISSQARVYRVYPQITDRILLELICKLSGVCCPQFAFERGVEELKWNILKRCIHYNKELKHQVRRLFGEMKNE